MNKNVTEFPSLEELQQMREGLQQMTSEQLTKEKEKIDTDIKKFANALNGIKSSLANKSDVNTVEILFKEDDGTIRHKYITKRGDEIDELKEDYFISKVEKLQDQYTMKLWELTHKRATIIELINLREENEKFVQECCYDAFKVSFSDFGKRNVEVFKCGLPREDGTIRMVSEARKLLFTVPFPNEDYSFTFTASETKNRNKVLKKDKE